MLTPPAGRRGSTSVTVGVAEAEFLPVALEPVSAGFEPLLLPLWVLPVGELEVAAAEPPVVAAAEPEGDVFWSELAAAEEPWVAD